MSTALEILAVLLGLSYLLLAVREQRLCWIAGGASSLLFMLVFHGAELPAQAALQGYYVAVAAHGWWHWGAQNAATSGLPVVRWSPARHAIAITAAGALTGATLVLRDTVEMLAVVDTAIGWGSVVATWMVARKVLENWLYWIVIDSAAVGLYVHKALPATAALYFLYTVIAFYGWRQWQRSYHRASAD